MRKFTLRIFLFLISGIMSANLFAQSNTITLGGTYKQNFDNMGDNANAALPLGWRASLNSGINTLGTYASAQTITDRRAGADMNSSNNSGIYNFGAGTTTQGNGDRAVGGVTGSTSDKSVNVYFDLNVAANPSIDGINVSYSIEKYRNGSNPDGYSVKLYYSTNGTTWSAAVVQTNYPPDANESGFNPAPAGAQTKYITGHIPNTSSSSVATHLYLVWNISTTTTSGASAPAKSMALAIDDVKIQFGSAASLPITPMYFRSNANGSWNAAGTWEFSPDNDPGTWTTANRAPSSADYTITIRSGNNVHVSSAVTTDQTTIDAGGTLTIDATQQLTITDGLGFDLNINGSLVNSGNLLIKSDNSGQSDIGTASVGPVTGTISGAGTATVERYISAAYARSAWRMVSAPLTSNVAASNKIWNNWQAAGSASSQTGTRITGPVVTVANGLDDITPQYSMKWWDGSAFQFIMDTKNTSLYAHSGYFLFVRGDRLTPTVVGNNGQTKLSATGNLRVGNIPEPTNTANDAYTMVGNPYASAVDLLTFNTDNSGSNTKSTYYLWDPYQTGIYGVGGFVTVSIDNLNNVTIVPDSSPQGDETRFLQSGQAMYVQTRSTGGGGTPSVTFNENQKSYNVANNILRTLGSQVDKLTVSLNVVLSGSPIQLDAIVAAFNSSYSSSLDNYDAHKMFNIGESISFKRNGTDLSIERRAGISSDDIFNLNLTALKSNVNYQLQIKPELSISGLNAFLVDNYLKTTTPIDLSKTTTVDFTINSDAASAGSNRFYISFAKPSVVTAAGSDGISVFPNPVTNGVINVRMNNMAAGVYTVRVVNGMGQAIYNRQINHSAGNSTETIQLGKGAVKGVYQLEVITPANTKFSSKVITN